MKLSVDYDFTFEAGPLSSAEQEKIAEAGSADSLQSTESSGDSVHCSPKQLIRVVQLIAAY